MAGKTWISPFSTPFLISLSNVRAQQFIDIDSGTLFALESIFQFKDALAQYAKKERRYFARTKLFRPPSATKR